MVDAWLAANRLARKQAGAIAWRQFAGVGISEHQISAALRDGHLERALPAAYVVAAAPRSRLQRVWSANLWAGTDAATTGRTAAELWRYDGVTWRKPEVYVPAPRHPRNAAVAVRRGPPIDAADLRFIDGLRVTSRELTLIRLSGDIDDEALEIAFESARRRRTITVESVRQTLDRLGTKGRPTSAIASLLAELEGTRPAESVLEVKAIRLLRNAGIEKPERQVSVPAFGSDYRADLGWPHRRTLLECMGRAFHDDPATFDRDADRISAMAAATGYTILVTTWHEVTKEPDRLIAKVRMALGHRAA